MARRKRKPNRNRRQKRCRFCTEGISYIDYKDLPTLKYYVNERTKIKARRTTGTCQQHQRALAGAIKNAREMALMPYSSR